MDTFPLFRNISIASKFKVSAQKANQLVSRLIAFYDLCHTSIQSKLNTIYLDTSLVYQMFCILPYKVINTAHPSGVSSTALSQVRDYTICNLR